MNTLGGLYGAVEMVHKYLLTGNGYIGTYSPVSLKCAIVYASQQVPETQFPVKEYCEHLKCAFGSSRSSSCDHFRVCGTSVILPHFELYAFEAQDFKPALTIHNYSLANIRRSRGYSYEHTLVQRLNNGKWIARRLGGSSTGLPDIVAVNNKDATLLSIEAKSGTGDALYVRADQLQRCLLIKDMFGYYKTKHVVLAFKFMRKKRFARKNRVVYEKRKLLEYYKIADKLNKPDSMPIVKCTYSGRTFVMYNGKFTSKSLPNYAMPFNNRHQSWKV